MIKAHAAIFIDTFVDINDRQNLQIRDGEYEVPIDEVAEFHAKHGGWVEEVIVELKSGKLIKAWGKSWVNDEGKITRIGAGSGGDEIVWRRGDEG